MLSFGNRTLTVVPRSGALARLMSQACRKLTAAIGRSGCVVRDEKRGYAQILYKLESLIKRSEIDCSVIRVKHPGGKPHRHHHGAGARGIGGISAGGVLIPPDKQRRLA